MKTPRNVLFLLSDEHGFRFVGHWKESEGGEPVETPALDFEAAEEERTVRDADLKKAFAQDLPPATRNQYLMPSGKLVNADDPLYNPTVIAETPQAAFSDWPGA